jgi:hypothetical protein
MRYVQQSCDVPIAVQHAGSGTDSPSLVRDERRRVYQSIANPDRLSDERSSSHGSALSQAYNHSVLPRLRVALWETQNTMYAPLIKSHQKWRSKTEKGSMTRGTGTAVGEKLA